jgi:hypothetical protein
MISSNTPFIFQLEATISICDLREPRRMMLLGVCAGALPTRVSEACRRFYSPRIPISENILRGVIPSLLEAVVAHYRSYFVDRLRGFLA